MLIDLANKPRPRDVVTLDSNAKCVTQQNLVSAHLQPHFPIKLDITGHGAEYDALLELWLSAVLEAHDRAGGEETAGIQTQTFVI